MKDYIFQYFVHKIIYPFLIAAISITTGSCMAVKGNQTAPKLQRNLEGIMDNSKDFNQKLQEKYGPEWQEDIRKNYRTRIV